MSFKLRKAILRAAAMPDIAGALRDLDDAVPDGWFAKAVSIRTELPDKHLLRLVGICLRADMFDEAAELLQPRDAPDRLPVADAVVIDSDYDGTVGHLEHHDLFYLNLMRAAGLEPRFLHRELIDGVPGHMLRDLAFFRHRPKRVHLFPLPHGSEAVFAVFQLRHRLLRRVLPERRPRLIVMPTVHPSDVMGLAAYFADAEPRSSTSILLGAHNPKWTAPLDPDEELDMFAGAELPVFVDTLKQLSAAPGMRLLLVGESPEISRGLARLVGDSCEVVTGSVVSGQWAVTGPAERPPGGAVTIGVIGRFVPERGSHLVPEIARRVLDERPDCVWRLHTEDNGDAAFAPLREARAAGHVFFEGDELSSDDYFRLLRSLDIVVMPVGSIYSRISSGLTAESLRFGLVTVVPEDSTMKRFAERYGAGCVTFAETNPEAVAAAVIKAIDNLPALREKSAQAIERFENNEDLKRISRFIAEA